MSSRKANRKKLGGSRQGGPAAPFSTPINPLHHAVRVCDLEQHMEANAGHQFVSGLLSVCLLQKTFLLN